MARHRFFYLLNLARHRVHKHTDRVAQEELGVTNTQLGALFVIGSQPGISQRELARTLGINDSAITALVRRMSEAELLERVPSPDDARVMQIRASRRGARIIKRAKPLLARFNERLNEGFDEHELDVVARFLEAAIERFDQEV